jgi:hypothetical protein
VSGNSRESLAVDGNEENRRGKRERGKLHRKAGRVMKAMVMPSWLLRMSE